MEITRQHIKGLLREALDNRDTEMAEIAKKALAGDYEMWVECESVIRTVWLNEDDSPLHDDDNGYNTPWGRGY